MLDKNCHVTVDLSRIFLKKTIKYGLLYGT